MTPEKWAEIGRRQVNGRLLHGQRKIQPKDCELTGVRLKAWLAGVARWFREHAAQARSRGDYGQYWHW